MLVDNLTIGDGTGLDGIADGDGVLETNCGGHTG